MPLNEMNLSLTQMTAPEYLIETDDSAPLWTHGVLSCLHHGGYILLNCTKVGLQLLRALQ